MRNTLIGKEETLSALACATAILLLSGCAVGPDYSRPDTAQPASLTRDGLQDGNNASTTVDTQWWKAFGSSSLDALVQEALDHSPTLEAASETLKAAHQNVMAQRGFFFPAVQLGYNPSRQNTGQSMSAPLQSGKSLYTYHTAQLSVSYAPDIWGSNRRQVEGLQAGEEQQRMQLQAARLTLTGNLVAAVIQTAMLKEQSELTAEAVKTEQEQLRHMQSQLANGYASGLDVATQQNLLLQLQQTLPPLQTNLEQTRNLVATLLGRTPDQAPPIPAFSDFHMPALPQAVASKLLEHRPDIRAAEAQVRQSSAAVGVAQAARLPQLSLTAAFGGGATSFANMFSAGNPVWSLGAGLIQPLFSGGALTAKQHAAENLLNASAAQYRGTVLSAFQDVANSLYALDSGARALQMSEASEQTSLTTFKLTDSQFKQGYAAKPVQLAAMQLYLQTKAATVQARGGLFGDAVALLQSLGGSVINEGDGENLA